MTRRHWFGLILGLVSTLPGHGRKREEEFVVIVHRSNRLDAVSCSQLRFLFLRKVSRWPWGAEVAPIDLALSTPARRWFTREVLRTTEEQLAEYWIDQRATRGAIPPLGVSHAAVAKGLVKAWPGAVAYIPLAEVDDTVKVLKVDP